MTGQYKTVSLANQKPRIFADYSTNTTTGRLRRYTTVSGLSGLLAKFTSKTWLDRLWDLLTVTRKFASMLICWRNWLTDIVTWAWSRLPFLDAGFRIWITNDEQNSRIVYYSPQFFLFPYCGPASSFPLITGFAWYSLGRDHGTFAKWSELRTAASSSAVSKGTGPGWKLQA